MSQLSIEKAFGECVIETITIYNKLKGVDLVDTLIHEMRHAQHPIPYEAEEFINQTSTELAEGLDQAGLKMSTMVEKTKGKKDGS